MPRTDIIEIETVHDDFSRGLVSGLSDLGLGATKRKTPIKWVRRCDNVVFRPRRAASVRGGSADTSTSVLTEQPTSLGKHYHSTGNKLFVATNDLASGGSIFLRTGTTDTEQTLPFAPTDQRWRFEMFNGVLVGCQMGGSQKPIFWDPTNPPNTWHSMVLPKPAAAPTFGADQVGGALTPSVDYFYRVRWRYRNGSSLTGPVSAAAQVVAASGNYIIRVNVPLPASPRSDYIGYTLERTKSTGSVLGPFYAVADDTAATYDDGKADSALHSRSSEVIHGEPPHFQGVIGHKGRLFGWTESLLYRSQPITGAEATGIFNWQGDAWYPFAKDDGDIIQNVVSQGDRLVVFKTNSIHVIEGDDEDNFQPRRLYQGVGTAGPRAAATTGFIVWFYSGQGNFNILDGDRWVPIADDELREYSKSMDFTRDGFVVGTNLIGDFLIFAYTSDNSPYNEDMVIYDLRQKVWSHFTGWRAEDMLVQKDAVDFNRAVLLFADPALVDSAGFVIPFGAEALPSPTIGYHIWAAFDGTSDYRDAGGSGGDIIPFSLEGPQIDDGYPNLDKDYEWIECYLNRGQAEITATILLDDGNSVVVSLTAETDNPRYDNGVLFDDGAFYAHPGRTVVASGLPKGTIARARAVRLAGATTEEIEIGGYTLRGYALPTLEYS